MAFLQRSLTARTIHYAPLFAKTSFLIYLFFAFFTTSLPFQDDYTDVEDIATGSLFRQLLYSSLYVVSFFSLLPKKNIVIEFFKKEKFLALFLVWSFVSVFWSDFPIISFKRWLQILGSVVVFLSALLNLNSVDKALQYLKAITLIYLPLCFLSVLFVPGAIQWEFPAWRGLAQHKNLLGQASLVGLIVWTFALWRGSSRGKKISFVFWVLSLVLLFGSKSATSIFAALMLSVLIGLFYVEKKILRPVIGPSFSLIFLSSFFLGWVLFANFLPAYLGPLFEIFQKDLTLTGRTDIWTSIFEEVKKHLFFGDGFGGFWVTGNPLLEVFVEEYFWLPNQAHNGYLDILNETGVIGILILALMLIFYFRNLKGIERADLFKWFVIAALIINITESTLFVPNSLTGGLFTLSYIALYTEFTMKDNSKP